MTPAAANQIEFIKDCLRKGEQRKSIIQKFTKKYNVGQKTFDVRLKIAYKDVSKDIERIEEAKTADTIQKALAAIVGQAEADAKTFRILSDDDIVEDVVAVAGKMQIVKRKPTQREIQNAYDLYNKRFGSNAPQKIDQHVTGDHKLTIERKLLVQNPDEIPISTNGHSN